MSEGAIPAATVIVVRDRAPGQPELLMVERAGGMAFAGGALVFPGGRIDPGDRVMAGAGPADNGPADDGAARVAAIRECLEETAVPIGLEPVPTAKAALAIRVAVAAGGDFAAILKREGLDLDAAALTPFARWLPDFHAARRFDTVFFVARAPPGDWQPRPLAGECTGAFWLSAEEALERERRNDAKLIFPTRRTLERLALHASYEAICADARAHTVERITPWVEEVGGERFVAIPDGLGFPVTREKLDGLWRG